MSKIICEICGTAFQDTAECCPICGYAHRSGAVEDLLADSPLLERGKNPPSPPAPVKKHKEIFDYDEVNPQEPEEPEYPYDDGENEREPRTNVLLVVLLVIIITLLLVATGFLFFRFYLPNAGSQPPQTEPESAPVTSEQVQDTTEPVIPCQSLALTSGVTELNREGQLWLLHVTVQPEDTTDLLVFRSEDESVVTVSNQGRLTAIGEGETTVYITCGEREIKCRVVVKFLEETAPTEQTVPQTTVGEEPQEPETTGATEATEETQPTEATETVVLKLKEKDLSSDVRGVSFDLTLDCDLKPEDVTWLTLDSRVAIVKNGTVTTVGPGMTKIVAQYQGQQVECIIRCTFK